MVNHAGGISLVTFVVALAVSMGYYQFIYIPQANAKPILPKEILEPAGHLDIKITPGSALPTNGKFFVPKDARVTLGVNNKVIWTNDDNVPHTVTSDPAYVDRISGPFDSLQQQEAVPGGYLLGGGKFEFVFTAEGEYAYNCVPHPHMQGTVTAVPDFS